MRLEGKYTITVGHRDGDVHIPMIVSRQPVDLYGGCSPKNPWESSLTFEHGKPICDFGWGSDPHGAEATLDGYIRLGTHIAFIPQYNNLNPPWYARVFIHSTHNPIAYVPQPPYGAEQVYELLLEDAVTAMLRLNGCNDGWAYCGFKYNGIYVDKVFCEPITDWDIFEIKKRWGSQGFVQRL